MEPLLLEQARLAHLRRVSPNRIIYRQSLNIWIGTTWNSEKLSQRHGEVAAPPMHHEVKATKTRGVGFEISSWFGLRRKLASLRAARGSVFLPRGARSTKTLWRARRRGEECLLAGSPRGNQAIGCRELNK